MALVHVDYPQVCETSLESEDVDGTPFGGEGILVPIFVPQSEIPGLLAEYDPTSGTSPGVTISRPLARAILNAVIRKQAE